MCCSKPRDSIALCVLHDELLIHISVWLQTIHFGVCMWKTHLCKARTTLLVIRLLLWGCYGVVMGFLVCYYAIWWFVSVTYITLNLIIRLYHVRAIGVFLRQASLLLLLIGSEIWTNSSVTTFVLKTLMIVYIMQLVQQTFVVTFISDFQSFLLGGLDGNNPINSYWRR